MVCLAEVAGAAKGEGEKYCITGFGDCDTSAYCADVAGALEPSVSYVEMALGSPRSVNAE